MKNAGKTRSMAGYTGTTGKRFKHSGGLPAEPWLDPVSGAVVTEADSVRAASCAEGGKKQDE